jgi:hypothetical protein
VSKVWARTISHHKLNFPATIFHSNTYMSSFGALTPWALFLPIFFTFLGLILLLNFRLLWCTYVHCQTGSFDTCWKTFLQTIGALFLASMELHTMTQRFFKVDKHVYINTLPHTYIQSMYLHITFALYHSLLKCYNCSIYLLLTFYAHIYHLLCLNAHFYRPM